MNIIFTQEGILANFNDFDKLENLPKDFNIKLCYDWIVEFSQDLTVERFFTLLEPYIDTLDQDFISWNQGGSLREFFKEMHQEPDEKMSLDIDFIEISRRIEFNYLDETFTEEEQAVKYIDDSIGMFGIGKDPEEGDFIEYSLDFVGINTYKNATIHINDNCLVTQFNSNDEDDEASFILIDEFEVDFTFHDLIKTFIETLSANGSPEERNETFQNILSQVQETATTHNKNEQSSNMDEVKLIQLQKEMEIARENEDFKRCSKLNKDIKDLQKKIEDGKN
jgi:hypothetical protein